MSPEGIRQYMHAVPFVPFKVRTMSGKDIPVPHPDFIWMLPGGRRVFITTGDDSCEMLDVFLIEAVVGQGEVPEA